MKQLNRNIIGLVIATVFSLAAQAGELKENHYLVQTDGSFADVVSDLNDVIVNRGLVIDFVGHVGKMLSVPLAR